MRLVAALNAEARPIIESFDLRARSVRGLFPIYENEGVALVVSGVGKLSAAAATSYLHAATGEEPNRGWLNLGVAGHPERALGEGVIAHSITDVATQRSWYPQQVIDSPCHSDRLNTVDVPKKYTESAMYDMEAAGYYATAVRCSTSELVHCYTVLSDNRETPPITLTAKDVTQLIEERIGEIRDITAQISALQNTLSQLQTKPVEFEEFCERWRFTVSQQHQLTRLLRKWSVLVPHQSARCVEFEELQKSEDVLEVLRKRIQAIPITFSKDSGPGAQSKG